MQAKTEEELRHVIYISKPTYFDHLVLDDILTKSRSNNPAIGVTGNLIYHADLFLQLLEGLTLQCKNCMKQSLLIAATLMLLNCVMKL